MEARKVVVKKYGNRRLYDSSNSRYVNLDEIAQMVREGRDVQVVDAATNEDLTRAVLTQIIVEHAKEEDSAFPLDVLRQMVVVSGRATNEATIDYMKAVFDMYQNAYRSVAPAAVTPPPSRFAGPVRPPHAQTGGDVDALKRRLEELEGFVSTLATRKARRKSVTKRTKK